MCETLSEAQWTQASESLAQVIFPTEIRKGMGKVHQRSRWGGQGGGAVQQKTLQTWIICTIFHSLQKHATK